MIRFLVPQYLFALSLLAVPVVIHLFNFRRYKKVLFTNVKFLTELKEETTRISRLKHLLILCCRLLAVAFIVLAFAQPFIPLNDALQSSRTTGAVGIYLDNSFSMDAVGADGVLLEVGRKKAREIALAYPPSMKFQLLTNNFSAVEQRLMNRDDFMEALSSVKFSPYSRSLKEILLRQKEALTRDGASATNSYIISDFQSSMFNAADLPSDSALSVSFVALPLQITPNVVVDSSWLSSPVVQMNQSVELSVKVSNLSVKDAENVPVRLLLNGAQKAVSSLAIAAGQSEVITFSFTVTSPGWQRIEIQITDHPITFDDTYFTSFEVKDKMDVLVIGSGNGLPYPEALYGRDAAFELRRANNASLDYSIFATTELIILEDLPEVSSGLAQELKRFVERGGSLAVFPDSMADLNSYNMFLSALELDLLSGVNQSPDKVSSVDLQHPLFNDVFESSKLRDGRIDYPGSQKHFDLSGSNVKGQPLMKLQGNGSLLYHYNAGNGNVYLFTVPMSIGFSNLAQHAVFPPLMYRMALLSIRPLAFANTLGQSQPILLNMRAPAGDEIFHLTDGKGVDIIPGIKVTTGGLMVNVGDQIPGSGHYSLLKEKKEIAVVAYNYNRKESVMQFQDEAGLREVAEKSGLKKWDYMKAANPDLTSEIRTLQQGIPLWKYAVICALIFLLLEIMLIRYWKTS